MRKNIFELEFEVKKQYATDKSSGKMYQTIKDLASAILVVKSMAYDSTEVNEISHICATDLYISINHKGLVVHSWTKYIKLRLYKAREQYLDECKGIELQIDDLIDSENFVDSMMGSTKSINNQVRLLELDSVINSLSELFFKIFDENVRYVKGSYEYDNIKISLMLSMENIIRNHNNEVILFNLDNSYKSYIIFLINLISKSLAIYVKKSCNDDLNHYTEMNDLITAGWNIGNNEYEE